MVTDSNRNELTSFDRVQSGFDVGEIIKIVLAFFVIRAFAVLNSRYWRY